ncbi:Rap1a/Tai family immunity protein [Marinobacterium aestuariivivens]|uniref:Rap1a/Tai family immunity protein n=1 Tax=Marinobacterium aestuariivivens TaxID=1698799 RepID=A0ABW2A4U4_9GAMM
MRIFTLLISILFSSSVLSATSAEQLLKYCETTSVEYCKGYISGFYDGRTTSDYGISMFQSCPPTDRSGLKLVVTYEQMRRVFIKWANNNPEKLHYEDWFAVREAFANAWPCK